MKKCSGCQLPKDESEFHNHGSTYDGLQSNCKPCARRATNKHRRKKVGLKPITKPEKL